MLEESEYKDAIIANFKHCKIFDDVEVQSQPGIILIAKVRMAPSLCVESRKSQGPDSYTDRCGSCSGSNDQESY